MLFELHVSSTDPVVVRTTATETFIGEESVFSSTASQDVTAARPEDSSNWNAEQQEEFLTQLLKASFSTDPHQRRPESLDSKNAENPMGAVMSNLMQVNEGRSDSTSNFTGYFQSSRSKTLLEKLSPVVHLALTWFLLVFFVLVKEPDAYAFGAHHTEERNTLQRWAELRYRLPLGSTAVQKVVSQYYKVSFSAL